MVQGFGFRVQGLRFRLSTSLRGSFLASLGSGFRS